MEVPVQRAHSASRRDAGFSLIEILVVIVILGILAAIAIPVFLNQRKRSVDASLQSDLRSVAQAEEGYFIDNKMYLAQTSSGSAITIGSQVGLSPGNSVTVVVGSGANSGAFCAVGSNPSATQPQVYKSNAGGLQPATVTDCAGF
ncbi:MAG: prepilin-type N-terminal cleavage/methylation domain-containing protein [Actinomycetota bacterium]|nr:MAG: prepilin-type N-terminal cleavage/methylation domain-containing protein [Actinomycetota bacterium]